MTYKKFLDKEHLKRSIDHMHTIGSLLNQIGIPFWLDYGTLLGCVRDKKIISNDIDIDFGIMNEDINIDLKNYFEDMGYKVFSFYCCDKVAKKFLNGEKPTTPITYGIENKDMCILDLYLYFDGDGVNFEGESIFNIYYKGGKVQEMPKCYVDDFEIVEFYEKEYRIPVHSDLYLLHRYGDNWKTPTKQEKWSGWEDFINA